jgi:pimeloyl-ACP methyl ester carboxylesterase
MDDASSVAVAGVSVPADVSLDRVSLGADRQLTYATYGASDGTPLLFLHGTPGSHLLGALYDEAATRRGVRVLAPARPGYAQSSPWPGRTLSETGTFVAALLDDLGVSRARLVGFSGGGPHALAVAATHPGRVSGVDLVSGSVPPAQRADPPLAVRALETLSGTLPALARALLRGQARVARHASPGFVTSQYSALAPDDLPEGVPALVRRDFIAALATASGTVHESRLLARAWDVDPASVSAPVRLWHGGEDENVAVAGARRLAERLPAGRLAVLDDADHLTTLLRSRDAVLERAATDE